MKNEVYFYFIYYFIIIIYFNSTPYMQYTGENELIPDEICLFCASYYYNIKCELINLYINITDHMLHASTFPF